ncbi:GNAT family N-acetyltransferase [Dyadobacter aurulentus]|uniref:GNAT family N-acetyltransferase n=1 Tax=Dyadobacter sp. UC 10 TaxID=2605428 RepID=UPI0011F2B862|nr:GNAT family N-acetyltransferase [Dyadobacter sp. UC 10]KAA0992146.1 GNAT family N-acetyltransferase [Dyadobacter sp. UC 10]
MDDKILIRPALNEDSDRIFHLAKQLSDTLIISESYVMTELPKLLADELYCSLVAVRNEMVVGYASGYFHHAIYAGGLVAYVDEIVVDVSCRSLKIGSMLMDRFEKVAREKDYRLVSLATYGAKSFYEKLGYETKAGYFKKYLT